MGKQKTRSDTVRLSIIIVTWNIRDVLRDCLESLFREDLGINYEVIQVDNGSEDGTVAMIEQDFPQINLILNDENLGFPKANNQGIEVASGDYVLLLNSDTIITDPTIFRRWISFMDENPDVGLSGCRLVFEDGTHQVGDAGYRPGLATLTAHNFFLNRLFPKLFKGLFVSYLKSPGRIEVDWISGADLLVRRKIIPEVGSLDENILIYAEDIEWGCRIRSHGYKAYYLPDLELIHLQGATTNQYPEQFSGMDLKNLRQLCMALNPRLPLFLYDLLMSIGFFLRAALYRVMFWKPDKFRHSRSSRMYKYFKFSIAYFGKPAK